MIILEAVICKLMIVTTLARDSNTSRWMGCSSTELGNALCQHRTDFRQQGTGVCNKSGTSLVNITYGNHCDVDKFTTANVTCCSMKVDDDERTKDKKGFPMLIVYIASPVGVLLIVVSAIGGSKLCRIYKQKKNEKFVKTVGFGYRFPEETQAKKGPEKPLTHSKVSLMKEAEITVRPVFANDDDLHGPETYRANKPKRIRKKKKKKAESDESEISEKSTKSDRSRRSEKKKKRKSRKQDDSDDDEDDDDDTYYN